MFCTHSRSTVEETCARCTALEGQLQQCRMKYEQGLEEIQRLRDELRKYGGLVPTEASEAGDEMVAVKIEVAIDPAGVKVEAADMDDGSMHETTTEPSDFRATDRASEANDCEATDNASEAIDLETTDKMSEANDSDTSHNNRR